MNLKSLINLLQQRKPFFIKNSISLTGEETPMEEALEILERSPKNY